VDIRQLAELRLQWFQES